MRFIVNDDSGFRPIHIHLTLDNKRELVELWKRLNLSTDTVDNENGCYNAYKSNAPEFERLWDMIDNVLKSLNS